MSEAEYIQLSKRISDKLTMAEREMRSILKLCKEAESANEDFFEGYYEAICDLIHAAPRP